jgi:hypothetical protein
VKRLLLWALVLLAMLLTAARPMWAPPRTAPAPSPTPSLTGLAEQTRQVDAMTADAQRVDAAWSAWLMAHRLPCECECPKGRGRR